MPQPCSPGAEVPILDQSRLLEQFGGEPEILAELRDLFLDDFPRQIEAMERGLAAGDADEVARAAHSLKGASGTFGADRVYRVTMDLEAAARAGDLTAAALGLALLRDELAKVTVLIDGLGPSS